VRPGIRIWYCTLVFMGGIISGGLFQSSQFVLRLYGIRLFVLNVNPGTNADFAKLLAWSICRVFSEKFVPNLFASWKVRAEPMLKDQSIS